MTEAQTNYKHANSANEARDKRQGNLAALALADLDIEGVDSVTFTREVNGVLIEVSYFRVKEFPYRIRSVYEWQHGSEND